MSEKWEFGGSGAACGACQGAIDVGAPFYSVLCVSADPVPDEAAGTTLVRRDYCQGCWEASGAGQGAPPVPAIAFWRTVRAPKEAARRGYVKVDIDLVWQIFTTMPAGAQEGVEAELRYVLALMLLRRRRLELGKSDGGILELRDRKGDAVWQVVDPVLGEERVKELTERLGELLWEREFSAADGP